MKFFYASTGGDYDFQIFVEAKITKVLVSAYHIDYAKSIQRFKRFNQLLVDSGGFTALKKNIDVPVGKYIDFINQNRLRCVFNLDVPSFAQTLRNQRALEKNTDARVIPIYHVKEWEDPKHRDWITDLIAEYDFISAGGLVGRSTSVRIAFLDFLFNRVRNDCPIHGLGIHAPNIVERYPFYSIDSTNWIKPQRYGTFIELKGNRIKEIPKTLALLQTNRHAFADYQLPYRSRTLLYAKQIPKWESRITELWRRRGIVWPEVDLNAK